MNGSPGLAVATKPTIVDIVLKDMCILHLEKGMHCKDTKASFLYFV